MSGTRSFLATTRKGKYLALDISLDGNPKLMNKVLKEFYGEHSQVEALFDGEGATAINKEGSLVRTTSCRYDPAFSFDFWSDLVTNALHCDCSYIYLFDGRKWGCFGLSEPYIS